MDSKTFISRAFIAEVDDVMDHKKSITKYLQDSHDALTDLIDSLDALQNATAEPAVRGDALRGKVAARKALSMLSGIKVRK